jgi:hypothetical protein
MKNQKNKIDLITGTIDLCDYKSEEAAAYMWDQWEVVNDHEQRIRKLESQLLELKSKLEEKKQVHHLGRVHEF